MMIGMIGRVVGSTIIAASRFHLGSTVRVRSGLSCLVKKIYSVIDDDNMIR